MALPNWLSFSQLSGSGDTLVTITAATYTEFVDRASTLVVSGRSKSVEVGVTQEHAVPNLVVSPSSVNITTASTSFTITVTSEVGWTASSVASWLTFSPSAGTSGTTTITVNATANNRLDDRSALLTVNDTYSTKSCNITQEGIGYGEYPIKTYHNVTSTTRPTYVIGSNITLSSNLGSYMVVDGEIVPISKTYQFSATGVHNVWFQYQPYQATASTIQYVETLSLTSFISPSLFKLETVASSGSAFRNNITAVTHQIGINYNNRPDLDCHCDVVDLRNSGIKRVYGVILGPNVKTVYFPASTTTFLADDQTYDVVFFNCESLSNIYCYATTPPDLGDMTTHYTFPINSTHASESSAYTGVARVGTLHVPSGSVAAYQADWMKNQKGYLGYQPANPNVPRYNWTVVGDL